MPGVEGDAEGVWGGLSEPEGKGKEEIGERRGRGKKWKEREGEGARRGRRKKEERKAWDNICCYKKQTNKEIRGGGWK